VSLEGSTRFVAVRLDRGTGNEEVCVVLDRNTGAELMRLAPTDLAIEDDAGELYAIESARESHPTDPMDVTSVLVSYALPSGALRWRSSAKAGIGNTSGPFFFEPDVVYLCDAAMTLRVFARASGEALWSWGTGMCDVHLARQPNAPAELVILSWGDKLQRFVRGGAPPPIIRNTFHGVFREAGKPVRHAPFWFGDKRVTTDGAGRYATTYDGRGFVYFMDVPVPTAVPLDARRPDRTLDFLHDEDARGVTR
jgi:hypothetical protein